MAGNNIVYYLIGGGLLYYLISKSTTAQAATPLQPGQQATEVSDTQFGLTKSLESFSANAYPDGTDSNGNQKYSIGYGHQIQPRETYWLNNPISPQDADYEFSQDMQNVVDFINNTGVLLPQNVFDALTDFGFNAGVGALQNIINTYNSQGDQAAQDQLLQYVNWHPVPGGAAQVNQTLVNRRNIEIQTWNQ